MKSSFPLPSAPVASVHDPSPNGDIALSRRRALVVLSAAPIAAACGATSDTAQLPLPGNGDPDNGDASVSTTPTSAPTTSPTTSPSTNPTTAPTTSPTSPPDSGAPKPDAATPEPDAASSPPDTAAACTPVGSDVGSLSSFPVNSWTGQDPIIIGHDSGGLFAYTATCTHHGCSLASSVDASTGAATCPCHGWVFTGTGACTTTPSKPLVHYPLQVCDGKVYVDTSSTVASTTRTPAS